MYTVDLSDVFFTDTYTGIIVGGNQEDRSYTGFIFRTTDGGATWTAQSSGTANEGSTTAEPNYTQSHYRIRISTVRKFILTGGRTVQSP